MGIFLQGRITTWVSVLILCPLAGFATFFFAWNLARRWPSPDRLTKIFLIAAMILDGLFAVKCLFMVHSFRLKSRSISFTLWAILGVAATIANGGWFILMASRKGYEKMCGDSGGCKEKTLSIAFSAFLVIFAILSFLIMLMVFSFDAHWNYAAPTAPAPTPVAMPPAPMAPMTTARSLAKRFLPSSFSGSTRGKERGHVPLINITHDYGDDGDDPATKRPARRDGGEAGQDERVLFDSAGPDRDGYKHERVKTDEFAASSSEESEDTEDEEAQLEYERRRRERKGKYREEMV